MVRRNRQRSRKLRLPRKTARRFVRTIVEGSPIRVPNDPPSFIAGPWWPLTLALAGVGESGTVNISGATIHAAVLDQLVGMNLDKDFWLTYRLLGIRAWGLSGQGINLTIKDVDSATIHDLYDFPSKTNYSKLGWKFGDSESENALGANEQRVLCVVSAAKKSKVLMYVNILMKFRSKTLISVMDGIFPRPFSLDVMSF